MLNLIRGCAKNIRTSLSVVHEELELFESKKILAIITARGGSKGLPKKNIKKLANKPLIQWTVEASLQSQYIDRVIVSSDSQEIIDSAVQAGAEAPFVRPADIAGDTAKLEDAILHAMQEISLQGESYDYMINLCPTHPLRDAEEIDRVIEYTIKHPQASAVMTVTECLHHPLQANILENDLSLATFMSDELKLLNRQELPVYYQLSGSVCISQWEYFQKVGTFLGPETYAYVTDAKKGLNIDSMTDFLLAEIYLQNPEITS